MDVVRVEPGYVGGQVVPEMRGHVLGFASLRLWFIQGRSCGRGKAFIDVMVGSCGYQLGCGTGTETDHQPYEHEINAQQNLLHDHMNHPVLMFKTQLGLAIHF